MAISRIRKNDTVIVVSGNDAGKTGTVLRVDPRKGVAVVGGVNVHKKAMRRTEKNAGGLVDIELPIRLCKLMPYDAEAKRGVRVRAGEAEGKKPRISVKSGKAIKAG
jgi:large subunit ribosomal protein L24